MEEGIGEREVTGKTDPLVVTGKTDPLVVTGPQPREAVVAGGSLGAAAAAAVDGDQGAGVRREKRRLSRMTLYCCFLICC